MDLDLFVLVMPACDSFDGSGAVVVESTKLAEVRILQCPCFASREGGADWNLKVKLGSKLSVDLPIVEDRCYYR